MLSTEYDLEDGQTSARSSTLPNSPAPAKVEQSPPMNLLWIPHSGSATTEETKPDHREINRRAQQNAFMKRKLARQQEFPRKKLVPPTRVSADLVRREADTPEPVVGIQRWPQSTSLTSTINPSQDYHAPSVRIYLDSLKLNPFRSGKVSMTPEMENIIMYYFTVIMPAVEPVQAEREDYNSWLVPLTASEPALLYALIGCMAYDMEQVSVVGFGPNSRLNLTQERVHYRIKAIQALNEALADPKTAAKPSTLVAVHFLLWQEVRLSPSWDWGYEIYHFLTCGTRFLLVTNASISMAFRGSSSSEEGSTACSARP